MKQKAAHTPGPWQIEWNVAQGGEGHYITDSKDMAELSRIAAVLFHDDADGETRANARLLAAKRGDVQATCRRLFAAGVPSDQCYCAAKALILSVRSAA